MVLVDTDILIDVARGAPEAVRWLRQAEKHSLVAVSVITEMELVVGCRDKTELHSLDCFLGRFRIIPLDEPISSTSAGLLRQYRLSHGLLIPDALIAGTATALGLPFATKNLRHYRFITGIRLLPYPESLTASL